MTRNMLLEIHPEGDIMLSGKSRTLWLYTVKSISYGSYRMVHIVWSISYHTVMISMVHTVWTDENY